MIEFILDHRESRDMPLMQDLLDRRMVRDFVGRQEQIEMLLETLQPDGPLVVFLYGIAGSGKSTLLNVFAQRARAEATVIRLDCCGIEPTEAGLLAELGMATGRGRGTAEEIAMRVGQVGQRVVLMLDTYEVFRLMDAWVRNVFVPLLPDHVRIVLCGREAPSIAWMSAPGWRGLCKAIELDGLPHREAAGYLERAGIEADTAARLATMCHGQPLALTLAASMQTGERTMTLSAGVGQRIVEELSRLYVSDIADAQTRRALEAACVVRRVTVPLLGELLPDASPQDAQERIRALPFVQLDRDGLRVHDAVRQSIAAALRAQNPQEYRAYRRAAYRHCMAELRSAAGPDLWRCTADLLYLLENPVLREAFFPSGAQEFAVEPAQAEDESAILEICERHETPEMARGLARWWSRARDAFFVAKDAHGIVGGFYCALEPGRNERAQLDDPMARSWMEHLQEQPMGRQQRALFLRRWLSAEAGEAPCAAQAACWIDVKRKYLELRPSLRRVYLTLQNPEPYAAAGERMGFQMLADRSVEGYTSLLLDLGPSSVDGWLAKLAASELGVEEDGLLDRGARELVVNGRRVGLTKLEFGVMEYLQARTGEAVTRYSLLENVWDQSHDGGSNVVDVVIRSLRKKLGDKASCIQTVQGVGYKLRREY